MLCILSPPISSIICIYIYIFILWTFFIFIFLLFFFYFNKYARIQERTKFGKIGWNANYDFNEFDYDTSVKVLGSCLESASYSFESGFQWKNLKFLIGEVKKNGFFPSTTNWCFNHHCSFHMYIYVNFPSHLHSKFLLILFPLVIPHQ